MASFGNSPNPWGSSSYDTYKDCSQGLCSIYCPQWCYLIFPPPPPIFGFENDSNNGGENDGDASASDFSPLIIAVIGILASAFILLSYYTLVSKYCRRRSRSGENDGSNENGNDGGGGGGGENDAASFSSSEGVGEKMIKSIKVYRYRRGDGFVDGTDCSVCLSEFEEDERLRLLPKCNHAFHAPCIDTWLKSHTSCPLCRSDIAAAVDDAQSVTTTTTTVTATAQRQLVVRSSEAVVVVVVDARASEESMASEEVVIAPPKVRDVVPGGFGSESGRISVVDILCQLDEDDVDEGFDSVDRMESGVPYGCFDSVGTSSFNNHDDHDHDDDDNEDKERSKLDTSGTHGLLRRSTSNGPFLFAKGKNSLLPN